MPAFAFSLIKTVVQTRAKSHTAEGHVCYVAGEKGTSTLETPVRNHHAKDPKERRRVIRMDPPRHYDYRNRRDVAVKGYAAPNGADDEWRDRHEWARRIEAADGKRTDSRQLRDDIVGIPLALVEQGTAERALQEYAQEIARLHHTPVHYAIHLPHKGNRNFHAHVLYAGRKLTADGRAFERRRDRSQDKPELIEQHKAIWTQVCRRYGLELDFTPQHPEQAPTPEYRLTARAIATERRAAVKEEGARLTAAVEAVGGAPLPLQEQQVLGEVSLDLDRLDTAGLLALPRTPVTTAARIAKHARRSIPAAAPAAEAPRPRPTPAPAIDAADLEVSPMLAPSPGRSVHVPRARPEAAPAVDPGRAPFIPRPFTPEPIAVPRARPEPSPAVDPGRAPFIPRPFAPEPIAVPRARPEPSPAVDPGRAPFIPRPFAPEPIAVPRARPEPSPAVDPGRAPFIPRPLAPEPIAVPRARPEPSPAVDPGRAPFIPRPFAPEPIAVPRARPEPSPAVDPGRAPFIPRPLAPEPIAVPRARPVPAPPVVASERPHERPVPAPACRPTPLCAPGPHSHPAGGDRRLGPRPTPAPPWEPARTRPRAAQEIEAPAPERARPVPAPAIGIPAPVPPRKAMRKWLKRMKTWWPWADKPPRPEKAVKVEPPLDLPRPGPALRIDPPRRRPPAPVPVLVFKPDAREDGPSVRRGIALHPSRRHTTQPAQRPPASTRRDWDFSR